MPSPADFGSQLPPVKLQVAGVEFGNGLEPAAVEDPDAPVFRLDQHLPAKLLDGPIDMDDGQAKAFPQLALSQREFERVAVGPANDLQPCVKLAEEMRHSRDCRALAESPISRLIAASMLVDSQ